MKRFYYTLLTFSLFLAIGFIYVPGSVAKEQILEQNHKIGRYAPVLANTALVRLKAAAARKNKAEELLAGNINIKRSLLPRTTAISTNNNKLNKLQSAGKNTYKIIRAEEPLLRTYVITYPGEMPPEIFCKNLMKNNPAIEVAEPYYLARPMFVPNDPKAPQQNMLAQVRAFDAWDHFKGDSSVVIAISDNGVRQDHPDLSGAIAPNWEEIPGNNTDDDGNGYIDDFIGYNFGHDMDGTPWGDTYNPASDHGTPVAGIAAAQFNNNEGITGTAGKCRMFPIKTGITDDTDIYFGYESIMYAGVRQFDVINCSWGIPKTYSDIDQTIIDYAISRGVAIVAAAGNYTGFPGMNIETKFFPAAYKGVMGIGEVNGNDIITSSSSLGAHTDMMAPGTNLWTTTNNNGYRQEGSGGTSFAAPVVAGALGFARARHPELGPLQAIEFLRQCGDDISSKNQPVKDRIPRRLNMIKIINTDPMSIPGLRPEAMRTKNKDGIYTSRFTEGDKVFMELDLHNYLGPAENLTVSMSLDQWTTAVEIIDDEQTIASVQSGEDITVEGFSFIIKERYNNLILIRFDITSPGGYHDYFTMPFTPTAEVITFANNVIKYSAGDFGKFGFAGPKSNKLGSGFVYKEAGNQLYEGGIMAVAADSRVVSSVFGYGKDNSDFASVKPFVLPDTNIAIIDDSQALDSEEIGIEITQEHIPGKADEPFTKINLSVKNISGGSLSDVAVGLFLDWDIKDDADHNSTGLLPEAIPVKYQTAGAAAEYAEHQDGEIAAGAAAVTEDPTGVGQAAGLNFDITWDFRKQDQLRSLGSGTSWQLTGINDVSMVVGMRFTGPFKSDETRECVICLAAGDGRDDLAANLRSCLDSEDAVDESNHGKLFDIYPQPADNYAIIENKFTNTANVFIYDIYGRLVFTADHAPGNGIRINTSGIAGGVYLMKIITGGDIFSRRIVIAH